MIFSYCTPMDYSILSCQKYRFICYKYKINRTKYICLFLPMILYNILLSSINYHIICYVRYYVDATATVPWVPTGTTVHASESDLLRARMTQIVILVIHRIKSEISDLTSSFASSALLWRFASVGWWNLARLYRIYLKPILLEPGWKYASFVSTLDYVCGM